MITANVFRRTFFIRYGDATGTAFTIDQNGQQYLVTAAHVCGGIKDDDAIYISRLDLWEEWPVKIVGMGDREALEADVAVFALPRQISPAFPMPATSKGLMWGQDVFFLGFPYGLCTTNAPNDGYPLAIVKRGLMSGSRAEGHGFETFLLDGHNNPGFSGGPVVFRPLNVQEFQVFGIVSGYQTENVDVLFEGKRTGLTSPTNTGIVVCPSIKRATDIIAANPIGPKITF